VDSPLGDAEIVCISYECLKKLNIDGKIWINDRRILTELIKKLNTSEEILKVMDKKYKLSEEEFIKEIEKFVDFYKFEKLISGYENFESYKYIKEITKYLDEFNIKYEINPYIVRGLDYYTGTIFEVYAKIDSVEISVCGGGRYDNLIEKFGGEPTPATGMAFGIDRLIDILSDYKIKRKGILIIPVSSEYLNYAIKVRNFINQGFIWYSCKLKSGLSYADKKNYKYVIILGKNEYESNSITIKDMETFEQKTVSLNEVNDFLNDLI